MTIATQTWEGIPHRCPICRHKSTTEVSDPAGDSCCPSCGSLMWVQDHRVARTRPRKKKAQIPVVPISPEWVREYCDAPALDSTKTVTPPVNSWWYKKWLNDQVATAVSPASKQDLPHRDAIRWYKKLTSLLARCSHLFVHESKKSNPKQSKKKSKM